VPQKRLEVVIAGDNRGAKKAMSDTGDDVQSLGDKMKSGLSGGALAVGTAAVGALAGIGAALKGAWEAAEESAKISRETERVIKTTGGAANITADQVGDLAGRLSDLTGVDDELIQGTENLLLTFTNVKNVVGDGNDVFTQATGLALDMAQVLGTDASGAAIQLGKALNDPVKGITALSKAGVSFTEQQKDQIKAMVQAGDTLGAQKVILAELSKEFGGAAEAAATPMDKLTVKIGNVQEAVGAWLIPAVDAAATWIGDRLPAAFEAATGFVADHTDAIQTLATVGLVGLAAAYAPVVAAQAALIGSGIVGFVTSLTGYMGALSAIFLETAASEGVLAAVTGTLSLTVLPVVAGVAALGLVIHGFAAAGAEGAKAADAFAQSLNVIPTNLSSLRTGIADASAHLDELGQRGSTAGDRLMGIADVVIPFHDVANSVEDARGEFERLGGDVEKWQTTLDRSNGTIDVAVTKLQEQAAAAGTMTLSGEALRSKLEAIAAEKQIDLTAPGAREKLMELYDATTVATPGALHLKEAFDTAGSAAATAGDQVKGYKMALDELIGVHISSMQAENSFGAALDTVQQKVGAGISLTDAYNARSREASGAVMSAADSAIKHSVSLLEEGQGLGAASAALTEHRNHLIATMVQTGMTRESASRYLDTLGLTPANIMTVAHMDAGQATAASRELTNVADQAARPRAGSITMNTGQALAAIGDLNARMGNLAGLGRGLGLAIQGRANGGITLHQYADGAHVAQIARAGDMRLWAEPETGGEAYIPLAGSKRGRSTAILSQVADMFGYDLVSAGGPGGGGRARGAAGGGAAPVVQVVVPGGYVGNEEDLGRVITRQLAAAKRQGVRMPWDN
jgi:hypothetical protein